MKSNCDRLKLAIGISAFFPLILLHYVTEARAYGSAYPQYCALKFFSFKTPVIDGCVGKIGAKGSPTWNSVKNSNKTCNAPSASEYDGLFDLGKKRDEFTTLPQVLTIKRAGMSFPAKVEVLHPTSRKIIHTTFETEFDHSGTALLNTGVQIGFDIFSKDQLSLSGDFGEMLFSTFCSEQKEIAFNFKGDEEIKILEEPRNCKSNYWLQTIVLGNKLKKDKNSIIKKGNLSNIGMRPCWKPLHTLKHLKKYPKMNLNNAEEIHERIINIPSSSHLKLND